MGRTDREVDGLKTQIQSLERALSERDHFFETLRDKERWFEAILENAPINIYFMDRDGRFKWVNKAFAEFFGKPAAAFVGASKVEHLENNVALLARAHNERVIRTGSPSSQDETINDHTFRVLKCPMFDDAGDVVAIIGFDTDITDLKRAEEALKAQSAGLERAVAERTSALQRSEERFKSLFENAEVSIWNEDLSEVRKALDRLRLDGVCDLRRYLDGNEQAVWDLARMAKVLHVNEATLKLFGAKAEDQLVHQIDKTFGPNAIEVFIDGLCAIWDKRTVFRSEAAFRTLDGKTLNAIVTFQIPEAEAGFQSIPISIIDITKRKRAEDELKKSEERFRDFAENAADWIWETDAEGRITFISEFYFRLSELHTKEVIGKTRREIYERYYEDATTVGLNGDVSHLDALDRREEFRNHNIVFIRPDGSRLHFLTNGWPIFDEGGVFHGFRGTGIDVTESKKLEEALAESEERFRSAFESVTVGGVVIDETGIVEALNATAQAIFGYAAEEVVGKNVKMLMPDSYAREHDTFIGNYLRTGDAKIIGSGREVTGHRKNGEEFPMHLGIGQMITGDRRSFIGSVDDLTELKALEEQLMRAQRMEAVGQLTGGVAHDFNNLMAAMLGSAELLGQRVAGDEKSLRHIERIKTAVRRGASLTYRLLAFSRKQTLSPRATDMDSLIGGLDDMLRRTLGETIDVKVAPNSELWPSMIDPSQLEHALINLAVNARDAMPNGGVLTLETSNATLDETYTDRREELAPGDYVKVSVSDNGTGMTPEVREKVFEPFFTTKEVGEGSGLGLSMVYGFAKQSGGHVSIYSEVDEGTTVSIYLPRSREDTVEDTKTERREVPRGSERILVVEGDEIVREIPVSYLRGQGYDVAGAADGKAAVTHLQEGPFDLLFTDVVLPGGISGMEIAREAKRLQPDIKVLYTTGYAENAVVHNGHLDNADPVIRKPYELGDLGETVRSVLDKADE